MAPLEIELILNDYALHTTEKRVAKTFEASIKDKTPEGIPYGRFYGSISPTGEFQIGFPQEMIDQMNRGELIVRCYMNKGGTPVFVGKDTMEKLAQIDKKKRNMGKHNALVNKKRHEGV